MAMYIVLFVVVAFAFGISCCLVQGRRLGAGAGLCVGILAVMCLPIFIVLLPFAAVFLMVLVTNASPIVARWALVAAACISLLLPVGMIQSRKAELAQMHANYPLESLEDRLSYENDVKPNATLASNIVDDLGYRENNHTWRSMMLKRLHDRTEVEFEAMIGFGVSRMRPLRESMLEFEVAPRVPQPEQIPTDSATPDGSHPSKSLPPAPRENDLFALHANSRADFLNPDRFGYVRDRTQVAGFVSHQFAQLPSVPHNDERWRLVRLELVSLLRHDPPRVYTSENLPRMDQLDDAPVRPLTPFESDALERIDTDRVVSRIEPARIRVLGRLIARESCTDCHSVQQGALLGALSYELAPVGVSVRRSEDAPATAGTY